MDESEDLKIAAIKEDVINSMSYELKILLENVAHLGLDAVRPRPNCTTTYVEAAHIAIVNLIRGGGK